MTLQELLEHAHLDALGCLDDAEQAAFEAAFKAAPAAVKAQVRAEQARWSNMDSLLPAVEPPAHLRDRVLDAVSRAMLQAETAGAASGTSVMSLTNAGRVSPMWRAGAIGMATAAVMLGGAFVMVYETNVETSQRFANGQLMDQMVSTWADSAQMRDALFSPSTNRVIFQAADESQAAGVRGARVALWANSDWSNFKIFHEGLAPLQGKSYRVVRVDASNNIIEQVVEFSGDTLLHSLDIPKLSAGERIALVVAPLGQRAVGSMLLMVATVPA